MGLRPLFCSGLWVSYVGGYSFNGLPGLSPHQLPHRLGAVGHEELRASREVGNRDLVHVDAEVVIERGEDFAETHGPLAGFAPETVRRADDVAGLHATAGEHRAVRPRPVIPST